ncbi:hypothetical protein [Magnetofaba australis]|uniref:hypothetical protein n=1 Tax=Magnetofaba australis TaxID=1472297 RepID=UPI000A19D1FE|nr:hypothetical protein [Magnetofaba australis]
MGITCAEALSLFEQAAALLEKVRDLGVSPPEMGQALAGSIQLMEQACNNPLLVMAATMGVGQ